MNVKIGLLLASPIENTGALATNPFTSSHRYNLHECTRVHTHTHTHMHTCTRARTHTHHTTQDADKQIIPHEATQVGFVVVTSEYI